MHHKLLNIRDSVYFILGLASPHDLPKEKNTFTGRDQYTHRCTHTVRTKKDSSAHNHIRSN